MHINIHTSTYIHLHTYIYTYIYTHRYTYISTRDVNKPKSKDRVSKTQ